MRRAWASTRRRSRGFAALIIAASWFTGPVCANTGYPEQAELIRHLIPSVVNITARGEVVGMQQGIAATAAERASQIEVKAGSGFVIDPSGMIITNWHVVDGAFDIQATFSDGTRAPARIAAAARVVDLALLEVKIGHQLPAVQWGDSKKLQVGDSVLAIGNALGIGISVSEGIVSALNRDIGDTPVDDFIQTDAAINHGNSGGPLFNRDGQVVGLNSAFISPTAANVGLGFAMPSEDVRYVIEHLMRAGQDTRPAWIGAKFQAITPELAEASGFGNTNGSIVAYVVEPGPAQRAGVKAGDVILTLNGQSPSDERALIRDTTTVKPGTEVMLGVWRFGQHLDLKVTLDPWPQTLWERNAAPSPSQFHLVIARDLGLTVVPLPDSVRARKQFVQHERAVLVTRVEGHTDAARRGVSVGDIILRVGEEPVSSAEEFQRAIDCARTAGHQFGMFLLLPDNQPDLPTRVPGPSWMVLQISDK